MTGSKLSFSPLLDGLFDPEPPKPADNADRHLVVLTVHPREWRIPFAHQWEADYEFDVEHPATCSAHEEDCPVADYLLNVGVDEQFHSAFPEPDDLTDDELAVLNGTVRFVTITRTVSSWSNAEGMEYDCDFEFTWHDNDHLVPTAGA